MKRILIYTLRADFKHILQNLSDQFETVVCTTFEQAMENIQIKAPHLIISDYKALHNGNNAFHNALNNDFILIDIPVIAISCLAGSDANILSMKQKLYMFNIKRYLHIYSEKELLQQTVEKELDKWNPNLGSYTHRFVKSFLLFAESKNYEQSMRIHLNYILSHYPYLSNVVISDIKFASAILSTTFTTQNYESVVELYANMRFAKPILQLLKNIYKPSTLEEEILSAVFRLQKHLASPNGSSNNIPPMKEIRSEILKYLEETYVYKYSFLQSYKDIIPFWESISTLLLKNSLFSDEEISAYLDILQECLLLCVVESQNGYLQIVDEGKSVKVRILSREIVCDTICRWVEQNDTKYTGISVTWIDESELNLIIYKSLPIIQETENKMGNTAPISKSIVLNEKELLHDAHGSAQYSAEEYLRDLGGVEAIEDELHLLDDSISEIFNLLDEKIDIRNESIRLTLIKCIREYRSILQNNFYEFQAIGLTLFKLENLLDDLINHPEIEADKFRRLLVMIFDDLSVWRITVFEKQATPDINYLDSSILSSSCQIEALFSPVSVENDDDGLELF